VLGFVAFISMTAMHEAGALRRKNPLQVSLMSNRWSVISPYHALGEVQSWVFGIEKDFSNVAPEVCAMSTVTLVSLFILMRRVSAPMRV
jgi:hypothetical protein